jgi:hypothetical protein
MVDREFVDGYLLDYDTDKRLLYVPRNFIVSSYPGTTKLSVENAINFIDDFDNLLANGEVFTTDHFESGYTVYRVAIPSRLIQEFNTISWAQGYDHDWAIDCAQGIYCDIEAKYIDNSKERRDFLK